MLADAKYYWNFEEDLNGDGVLQINEVRDVRDWGSTNAYAGTVKASGIVGNDLQPNGPTWVETTVCQPGRGLRYTGKALHFTVDNRATSELDANGMVKTNCCPVGFQVNNAAIMGTVTVLMRCRMDSFNSFDGYVDHAWLVNNGEYWSCAAGSNFGFYPNAQKSGNAVKGYPAVYFGQKELRADFALDTNVWYDVGIVLKDTGDGGAEALFIVHDEGLHQAYGSVSQVPRKPNNFKVNYKTLKAGSGAFTNEVKHSTSIKIGAESPGARGYQSANKGFAGDVQRVVMWDRALTEDELKEAITAPSQLFKVGIEDGKSGEFGIRSEIAENYVAEIPERPWHLLPSGVDASNPSLQMTFVPKGEAYKMGQILRVRAAAGATGATQLRATVNGTVLGTKTLEPLKDATWFVKAKNLKSGSNTLTLERLASSTAASLSFDVIEMLGSWIIGVDNGQNSEFSVEGCTTMNPCWAYVGNYDWGNVQRGIPTSWPSLYLRFYVPEALARRHDFTFSGRVVAQGASDADRYVTEKGWVKNQYPFWIELNGTEMFSTTGLPNNTVYSFGIPAGTLSNGWNTIRLHDTGGSYKYPDKEGYNHYWCCFDFHKLEILPISSGTIVIIR